MKPHTHAGILDKMMLIGAPQLFVGRQIYLYDNPLLKRPGARGCEHMLLGHWGTTPGQNFIYMH